MKPLTIAVDGYSGCGKSTIAKDLAKHLSYVFIDSGAMYRGVTLYALEHGFISENHLDAEGLIAKLNEVQIEFRIHPEDAGKQHLYLNGRDVESEIRSLHVSGFVSQIATIAEVRKKMVDIQRRMGESGGVVMDGRDIGSVVFPNAELKFFVTAKPEVRAMRRKLELEQKGEYHSLEEILENLQERDAMDTSRSNSPLIQVPDAIVIDTSDLTRESQLEFALSFMGNRNAL
jgi:cytidylate kinase